MKIIIYSIIFVLAFGAEQALPQSSEGKPQAKEAEIKKEEVTFQNGGVTLSGDLCTPSGDGPFPVFIWCHGSRAQGESTGNDTWVSHWQRIVSIEVKTWAVRREEMSDML